MSGLTFTQKRSLTIFAFSLKMLFMGIEFTVIFPSVWLYLKIFHVDYWYLGLVLSAYHMVGTVSTVLVGRLADATRRIRFTGFIWNIAEISGNIIYALHFHVAFPLIGRMVAGFGEGFSSVMWAELARVTTGEQRTRYFAILKGSNFLGNAIGPALNLFLKEFNFVIGKWHIDFRTSSGFFMGLVWVPVTAIMLVFVYDLSSQLQGETDYKLLQQEDSSGVEEVKEEACSLLSGSITPDEPLGDERSEESVSNAAKEEKEIQAVLSQVTNSTKPVTFEAALKDMFWKFQVIVLVYLLFFMYVTHTCLQGITPLVAEHMLNWNETSVSIVYTVWGVEIIAVLVVVWLLSPRVSDRVILLFAVICGTLAAVSLIVLSYSKPKSKMCYYSFLVTIFLGGVAVAITVVIGRSLVSKHTSLENQGLVHAILSSFNRMAGLTGPIFGSSLYTHMTIMGCIVGGVHLLGLILVIVAFKSLKPISKKETVK